MKNHLFMIHRAIEPLIYDIQRSIFDIIINKCDYLFENFKNKVIMDIESFKLPHDIKYIIKSSNMYNSWEYKPPSNIKIICIEIMLYDWVNTSITISNNKTTKTINEFLTYLFLISPRANILAT